MATLAGGSSQLRIKRFRAQYAIASGHPSPERLRARLDEAVLKTLPGGLAAILGERFSDTDSSVWLIRRLGVDVDLNAAWEREPLARAWGSQIVRRLTDVLQDGPDGENVAWFPNRAAFLARFLADLASGCAWGKWHYESFEGLRPVPTSAALCTAICEQPAAGLEALLQLPAGELKSVLRALSPQDARRIFDHVAKEAAAGDASRCLQAAWSSWETVEWGSFAAAEEWRNALRLYVAARRRGGVGGPPLRTAALALLRLARCLAGGSTPQGQRLLAVLTRGDMAALALAAGGADAAVLAPLLHCPAPWLEDLGRALLGVTAGPTGSMAASTQGPRHTSFGGVFVLLPFLDALPLAEATRGWPDAEEATAAALVRLLVLVKCCGEPRAQSLFADPLVREIMAIGPSLSQAALGAWRARISRAHLQAFLDVMHAWQVETGAVGGRMSILTGVPVRGRPIAVLIDGARGVWLAAAPLHPRRPDRLVKWLRGWLARGSLAGTRLLCDDVFTGALQSAFPDVEIISRCGQPADALAQEDAGLAEILARLEKLPNDLAHLSLPSAFRLARPLDLALTVAAQGVMRAFAWRLPGFGRSNLPYLYTNFLDGSGSLEDEAARRVVRLAWPPLHLILHVTGLSRATYRVGWLDERPFALFPEE